MGSPHDGTPSTSADVVFGIERAKAEISSYRNSGAEAADADTVRFTAATAIPRRPRNDRTRPHGMLGIIQGTI